MSQPNAATYVTSIPLGGAIYPSLSSVQVTIKTNTSGTLLGGVWFSAHKTMSEGDWTYFQLPMSFSEVGPADATGSRNETFTLSLPSALTEPGNYFAYFQWQDLNGVNGVQFISNFTIQPAGAPPPTPPQENPLQKYAPYIIVGVILLIIILAYAASRKKKRGRPRRGSD